MFQGFESFSSMFVMFMCLHDMQFGFLHVVFMRLIPLIEFHAFSLQLIHEILTCVGSFRASSPPLRERVSVFYS